MPFINDTSDIENPKTVDVERDIIFKKLYRGYPQEDGISFSLIWDNQEIYIEGNEVSKVSERKRDESGQYKFNLEWIIHAIDIPEGFPHSNEKVFEVISDAFDTYGEFYDNERVESVKINHTDNAFDFKGYYR